LPEQKSSEPLKVTDKRMFTSDGDLRDEFRDVKPADPDEQLRSRPEPPPEPPPQPQPPPGAQPRGEGAPGREQGPPSEGFVQLVTLLAQNSLALMGMLPDGQFGGRADLRAARQMIDMIAMLEEKTKGNLNEQEQALLHDYLSELKLAYVQSSKKI
jgi:hypothetical protein